MSNLVLELILPALFLEQLINVFVTLLQFFGMPVGGCGDGNSWNNVIAP